MGKSPAGVDWYDAAVLELENGATVSLSGSSTVPKSCAYQIDVRIFGSEGMLLLDIERERLEAEEVFAGNGIASEDEEIKVLKQIEMLAHAERLALEARHRSRQPAESADERRARLIYEAWEKIAELSWRIDHHHGRLSLAALAAAKDYKARLIKALKGLEVE